MIVNIKTMKPKIAMPPPVMRSILNNCGTSSPASNNNAG